MRRYPFAALAVVSATLLLVLGYSSSTALQAAPSSREAERIRAHLAGAEDVLTRRYLRSLTSEQRQARSMHLSRLREYRERGVFPHNHDFPGERRPYFVDEHGVLCAMAYLISESGRDDIVQLVKQSRNNATVLELAADPTIGPVLAAWLEEAGMTVAEAQRVQPAYGDYELTIEEEDISTEYAIASAFVTGSNLALTIANFGTPSVTGSPKWTGYAGLLGGAIGMGMGGAILLENDVDEDTALLGFANLLAGSVSLIAGSSSIVRARRPAEMAETRPDPAALAIRAGVLTYPVPGVGFSMRF